MIKRNLFISNNIQKKYLDKKYVNKLSKKFSKVFKNIIDETNNPKKTLNILSQNFKFNFQKNDLQKFKKYKTIAIIGMGGSILGTEAISCFLKSKIKKKIYFFDNLDSKKVLNFKKKKLSEILFLVISKSGNTIETLSNFFILNIIKKNAKNIILISENKNNLLLSLSKKFNLFYIQHNKYIGGRFSVLSEVGIVPSYLMDIDTAKLRFESKKFLKGTQKLFLKNSSIKLACLLKKNKINDLIFINYSPQLEKFLFWCQQLIAESLGKKGRGFLPMISSAPKDHHSLLQLYLDGPKNKLFYIFSHEEKINEKLNTRKFDIENYNLNNKTLENIKFSQKAALIKAFNKNKIPFREFKIKKANEEVLGELFSYFILETVLIGNLLGINPYNQPAVEQVKVYTKEILN